MNIHHLELFYYVAKHGGIMEAVRNMPYGIQQPAVSGQIIQLEDSLGVKLFQRRPFLLSPGGQKLYDSIRPFFDSIDDVCEQIREGTSELIRLGAPTLVLDRYFPEIIHALKETLPDVKFALKEGHTNQVLKLLLDGQIDIAITTLTEDIPKGVHQTPLIDIELNLLVPKKSKIKSTEHLWEQDRIADPLISLPPQESISKHFQSHLETIGVAWPARIELSSLGLIERYVAAEHGVGLGIQSLSEKQPKDLRRLRIDGLKPITIGVLWRNQLNHASQQLVQLCQAKAAELSHAQPA
jgi:DNA-binding transcriptional LysR family regulator